LWDSPAVRLCVLYLVTFELDHKFKLHLMDL
jgi:hypothetical protein